MSKATVVHAIATTYSDKNSVLIDWTSRVGPIELSL